MIYVGSDRVREVPSVQVEPLVRHPAMRDRLWQRFCRKRGPYSWNVLAEITFQELVWLLTANGFYLDLLFLEKSCRCEHQPKTCKPHVTKAFILDFLKQEGELGNLLLDLLVPHLLQGDISLDKETDSKTLAGRCRHLVHLSLLALERQHLLYLTLSRQLGVCEAVQQEPQPAEGDRPVQQGDVGNSSGPGVPPKVIYIAEDSG